VKVGFDKAEQLEKTQAALLANAVLEAVSDPSGIGSGFIGITNRCLMLQDRRALTWDLYHQVVAISAGGWLARSKLVLTMTMRRSSSRSASHLPASGDFRPLRLRGEGGRSRALRTAASQRLLRELERRGLA
jgi:hypothetical protein